MPARRELPAAELLFQPPAPRPAIMAGTDARLLARRALDYGDGNAERLAQARQAYERLRETLATSEP